MVFLNLQFTNSIYTQIAVKLYHVALRIHTVKFQTKAIEFYGLFLFFKFFINMNV